MWEWRNIYRGLLMGASDVVPGVSGGTIAVVLGIYDRLIEAINGFFSKEWKKHLKFLLPLGIGIVTSIALLASVIDWLFEHYPGPTQFFFLGLIIGVLPYLTHKADMKNKFQGKHYVLLLIGAAVVASMAIFQTSETTAMEEITMSGYLLLFFSGWIASSAMILPGISGSFILLIIGVYTTVTSGISDFRIDIIAVVGFGILLGLISMSKIVKFFLDHYTSGTFAVIIGLVIGSVFVIFPGVPESTGLLTASIITFLGGLLAAWLLGRVEYKG
ncbi:DUF368 domain-containing protein [Halobacillus litoralis]|uniref:DUF368 domain-containing protein n=1 Tax=Halobacillus litoralis TaxID=45668 RepID=A0A845DXD7_9BACI|nr:MULTISPECIES: DUF368 domain-containing protein [Halobacillus]MCA1023912.1 DUF368 domain-containing protein [Halobacillus litoralis]MYL21748.1 DUF368 domain-containing protein [Halobacillus litoralis]MYL31683.1 DUF368 domain-containing protein [Halobacillus halophilus]MYL39886.1 DUF368 domain-containing protein [Halobacillus litoralis]